MLATIRTALRAADRVSPRLAGAMAEQLFRHPPRVRDVTPAQAALIDAARPDFERAARERVRYRRGAYAVAYRFEALGPRRGVAAVVHGWTSRALYMATIARRLQEAGFDVVAVDLPAHGAASGLLTDARACAEAFRAVARAVGPLDFIVGHSFGGAVIALGLDHPDAAPLVARARIALLASPTAFSHVTGAVAEVLQLSPAAKAAFERRACARLGLSMDEAAAPRFYAAIGRPLLAIHCRDDAEIAFSETERWALIPELASVAAVSGVGHRDILHAEPVLERLLAFATDGAV